MIIFSLLWFDKHDFALLHLVQFFRLSTLNSKETLLKSVLKFVFLFKEANNAIINHPYVREMKTT